MKFLRPWITEILIRFNRHRAVDRLNAWIEADEATAQLNRIKKGEKNERIRQKQG